MSITPDPTPDPTPVPGPTPTATAPRGRRSLGRDLTLVLLPVLIVLGGAGAYLYWGVYKPVGTIRYKQHLRSGLSVTDRLDDEFTADGDSLVAAPPADVNKQLDPDTLKLGVLDPETEVWSDLARRVEAKTGKKVVVTWIPASASDAVRVVKEEQVHVLALTTGAVPTAVNKAGVVPFAVPADDSGTFGFQMEILVRSDSPIKSLKDLKGRKIHLGSFSSLSSFKAPVVLLWEKENLVPGEDYDYSVTTSRDLVRGIVWGDYEVIPIASDLLHRQEAEEKKKAKQSGKKYPSEPYRSIYKSKETYPPFCFAYVSQLKPALAAKVREAFVEESYRFRGALKQAYAGANQTRFVAVTYKKDFESVRAIERKLLEMTEPK